MVLVLFIEFSYLAVLVLIYRANLDDFLYYVILNTWITSKTLTKFVVNILHDYINCKI